ncbi:MAG: ribonuclease P protein component [Gemmatimonadota bacterium]
MSAERLPRASRIRSAREIRQILRGGDRWGGQAVDIFTARSPAGRPRIGVVVPSYGRTLVQRNRVKRRLREIARREWLPGARQASVPWDILLRARPAAYDASFAFLREALCRAFERIGSSAPTDETGSTVNAPCSPV